MKKISLKFDKAKLQGFFVQHVEKIVLGIVMLVVIWFIYKGYSLPGLESNKQPDSLARLSSTSTDFIKRPDTWGKLAEERTVNGQDLKNQLAKAIDDNQASAYALPMPWNKPNFPRLAPRTDPKLFPPINLKVVPVIGPLAYNAKLVDLEDPLASELNPALAEEPETKPGKRPRRPKNERSRGEESYGLLQGESSYPVPGYPQSGMEGAGAAGSSHPEAKRGYQPKAEAVAKSANAMVVMAVVPYEKQFDEYLRSLSESLEFDPIRDAPRYLMYYVERADVTADPTAEADKLTWVRLSTTAALNETAYWDGSPAEILDPNFLDPVPPPGTQPAAPSASSTTPSSMFGVLTHPAPPFMIRDNWEMLTHPDVPLIKPVSLTEEPETGLPPRLRPDGAPKAGGDEFPMDLPRGISRQGGESYQQPGVEYGRVRPMPGYGAMPGYEGSGSGSAIDPTIRPKYKLLRFTDLGVETGRKYRYRIRVLMEDPNDPSALFTAPPPQSLANEVMTRLREVEADEKTRKITIFYRFSDWSEPSAPAELPPTEKFLAMEVDPPASSEIIPGRPRVPNNQAKAKLLTVVWSPKKATDLAALAGMNSDKTSKSDTYIYQGSLLSFSKDADALHPTRLTFVTVSDAQFPTGAIVADFNGGEVLPPLKRSNDNPLKAPAEILVFDAAGKLLVANESEDVEDIRRLTPVKVEVKPTETPALSDEGGYGSILEGPVRPPPRRRGGRE